MGNPIGPSTSNLASQHERLILERTCDRLSTICLGPVSVSPSLLPSHSWSLPFKARTETHPQPPTLADTWTVLPFKESRNFQEWLQSSYVRGSWHEYCRDFLAANPTSPEVDKAKTSQAAKDAINSRNPRYLLYHPDKDGWTPEDHVVRFIVAVVADNMLKSIWSDHDWKKRNIEVCKAVYEVLSFLRGTDFGAPMPPRYEASLIH